MGTQFVTGDAPGDWRQDPVSLYPDALGTHRGQVRPFVLKSGDQFRASPPPSLQMQSMPRRSTRRLDLGVTAPSRRLNALSSKH